MNHSITWKSFKSCFFEAPSAGFSIDVSRVNFVSNFFEQHGPQFLRAFDEMAALESGAVANPDEKRQVGHYWLRNSKLAPNIEMRSAIDSTLEALKAFVGNVHSGRVAPPQGGKYNYVLVIGIGGSALGPQFVSSALSAPNDPLKIFFFDNTDPDGMQRVIASIPDLAKTLCVVISKSGGTKETRNGQLAAKEAYLRAGLEFRTNFIAVTCENSELDKVAIAEQWLARFPMWDWIGGRTSELSVVGLLPAALQGFDVDRILQGAREMDQLTRERDVGRNPAMLLAASWYQIGGGKGQKDMVVLPYKDRLELFSRYLQQLVMESLGKERDRSGKVVNQGIAVYGNKGSTDQHAYVQQLRDGLPNFFALFIEVLKDRSSKFPKFNELDLSKLNVEADFTNGDYLFGFYEGTRRALYEAGRESISITIDEVNEYSVGALIALFERAVGFYASMVDINAYHQPGVEAGKKAATQVLALQSKVLDHLKAAGRPTSCDEIAKQLNCEEETETIFKLLRHLAANGRVAVQSGATSFENKYSV